MNADFQDAIKQKKSGDNLSRFKKKDFHNLPNVGAVTPLA
jgi:hypothetical protein